MAFPESLVSQSQAFYLSGDRYWCSRRELLCQAAVLVFNGVVVVTRRVGAADIGVDPGCRACGKWRPALVALGSIYAAALGVCQARSGRLSGRLYGAT